MESIWAAAKSVEDSLWWGLKSLSVAENCKADMGDAFGNVRVIQLCGIRTLLKERGPHLDPFVGTSAMANLMTTTNDSDEKTPADFHLDALEFMRSVPSDQAGVVLLDPPEYVQLSYIEDLMKQAQRVLRAKGALVVVLRTRVKPAPRLMLAQESTTVMHMRDDVYSVTVYRRVVATGH